MSLESIIMMVYPYYTWKLYWHKYIFIIPPKSAAFIAPLTTSDDYNRYFSFFILTPSFKR